MENNEIKGFKKVRITQVRSTIKHPGNQLLTLQSLGLGRIGKSTVHLSNSSTWGKIRAVNHLVVARGEK
jgi:large subunit ribosomal protein L30